MSVEFAEDTVVVATVVVAATTPWWVLDRARSRDTARAGGTEPSRDREVKEEDGRGPNGPSVERAEPERGRNDRSTVVVVDVVDVALGTCLNCKPTTPTGISNQQQECRINNNNIIIFESASTEQWCWNVCV